METLDVEKEDLEGKNILRRGNSKNKGLKVGHKSLG